MTAFLNIENFRQQVAPGFQRLNKYLVRFPIPPVLNSTVGAGPGSQYYNTLSKIEFYTSLVELPGVATGTVNVVRYGYGATESVPYVPLFENIQMMFYDDVNNMNLTFFQGWLNNIQNYNMSEGINGGSTALSPYEGYYKDDYAVDGWIILLSDKGEEMVTYRVRKMYPVQVFNTKLFWAAREIFQVSVYFNYMDWYIESMAEPQEEQFIQAPEQAPIGQPVLTVRG